MPITDPTHRPTYHAAPPENWLNDPNGLIVWRGRLHVFYQHNPHGPQWGDIHWGHFSTTDLIHWQAHPVALIPTPGSPDQDGCWSGCAVVQGDRPTLLYSGNRTDRRTTCLAYADQGDLDHLDTWHKHPGNPVHPETAADHSLLALRDPCVWREGDEWRMILGGGIEGVGGVVLMYRSVDLLAWEEIGPLCIGTLSGAASAGVRTLWECPHFFPFGNGWALIVSVNDHTINLTSHSAILTGQYDGTRFYPDRIERLDGGSCFYAPQSVLMPGGERVLLGWLREEWPVERPLQTGYAGCLSLPRVLTPNPVTGWRLAMHPALDALPIEAHDRPVPGPGEGVLIADVGRQAKVSIRFDLPGDSGWMAVELYRSDDGEESTRLTVDRVEDVMRIDRTRASLDPTVDSREGVTPLPAIPGPLTLDIWLDGSVMAASCAGRMITSRVYPTRPDAHFIQIEASADAVIESITTARIDSLEPGHNSIAHL